MLCRLLLFLWAVWCCVTFDFWCFCYGNKSHVKFLIDTYSYQHFSGLFQPNMHLLIVPSSPSLCHISCFSLQDKAHVYSGWLISAAVCSLLMLVCCVGCNVFCTTGMHVNVDLSMQILQPMEPTFTLKLFFSNKLFLWHNFRRSVLQC